MLEGKTEIAKTLEASGNWIERGRGNKVASFCHKGKGKKKIVTVWAGGKGANSRG